MIWYDLVCLGMFEFVVWPCRWKKNILLDGIWVWDREKNKKLDGIGVWDRNMVVTWWWWCQSLWPIRYTPL